MRSTTLFALLALGACASQAVDSACTAFRPIYMTDEAIAALRPHRDVRTAIATHNRTYEELCK